jgi:hypothetical protein
VLSKFRLDLIYKVKRRVVFGVFVCQTNRIASCSDKERKEVGFF